MIKLIASDIDGTLVEEGSAKLPEELFPLIEQLHARGIRFAAASGRQYLGLRRLFEPVADKIVFISENGTNVVSCGEQLHASVIDRELVREMQLFARTLPECYLTLSTTGAMYSNGSKDEAYRKLMLEGYHNDMVFSEQIDPDRIEVIKMSLYCESGIGPYTEKIEKLWGSRLNVAVAGIPWIDFSNKGADKGAALKLLQKKFGVDRKETMAFGDNHNDVGMIQAAGESYAVATARTAVKRAAKYIVGSYEEKGVIRILKKVIENQ